METSPAYGLEQARTQLPRLAAEAHAGTQSIITKHGKPYAAIVPLQDAARAANRGAGVLDLRGSGAGLWDNDAAAAVIALRGEWEAP
jgi:prevent-host-death family protein